MAVYDGFFDAVLNEESGEYDRAYSAGDFTGYFGEIIGSGVCVHDNPDSFKVRLENGAAVVSPGYLFIQGYWLRNTEDYTIPLTGTGTLAIAAHLNTGRRMIELEARSMAQSYPDSLVLALVTAASGTVEDTRYNSDICGIIDTAGSLSGKVEWAINYIDTEIEDKLAQAEADINAQAARLDAQIAAVQAVADRIAPPPIGSIKFSASQDVGEDWLKCDGSFVNEADYPELVEALGKLIPSGDKFQLISEGEIGPQISNGVLYGGRMWVYSYSTKKLYGVDVEGTAAVKEITLSSEDQNFQSFIGPSVSQPIALSITGGTLFLAQILSSGLLIFCASFTGNVSALSVEKPFNMIGESDTYQHDFKNCVPYVVSNVESGETWFYCVINGYKAGGYWYYIKWKIGDDAATYVYVRGGTTTVNSNYYEPQRIAFSKKSKNDAVMVKYYTDTYGGGQKAITSVVSTPNNIFSRDEKAGATSDVLSVPNPLNIVGQDKVLFEMSKTEALVISLSSLTSPQKITINNVNLPTGAKVFVDGGAYLWGKNIYIVFVGTGILFSRDLTDDSWGYLDTTSVLGTITQFGFLDYSEDEGTLYLLGQDTTNTVKVAKIVLNTLYDYANDGAWLPMIASDGVPAYIKAKSTEEPTGPTVPAQVKIVNNNSEYVSVLFNGEKLIPGTYTRQVSENGKFSIGLRLENKWNGSREYGLNLNGSAAVRISEISSIGTVVSESFNTQDYISGLITLTVTG